MTFMEILLNEKYYWALVALPDLRMKLFDEKLLFICFLILLLFSPSFFHFYFLKWQDFTIVIGDVRVGTAVPAVQSKVPPRSHAEFPLRRFCSLRFQPPPVQTSPIIGRS